MRNIKDYVNLLHSIDLTLDQNILFMVFMYYFYIELKVALTIDKVTLINCF